MSTCDLARQGPSVILLGFVSYEGYLEVVKTSTVKDFLFFFKVEVLVSSVGIYKGSARAAVAQGLNPTCGHSLSISLPSCHSSAAAVQ